MNTAGEPARWHRLLPLGRQQGFEAMGWTEADWRSLYQEFAHTDQEWGIREWLCNSSWAARVASTDSAWSLTVISPAGVRAAYTAYGDLAVDAINAYGVGASDRFVTAFIAHACGGDLAATGYPVFGWQLAQRCGLTEPAATGWAITGILGAHNDLHGPKQIRAWTKVCGPEAWLWVLAGYTLKEVQAMPATGRALTGEQLRVMVALAGTVLPPGL